MTKKMTTGSDSIKKLTLYEVSFYLIFGTGLSDSAHAFLLVMRSRLIPTNEVIISAAGTVSHTHFMLLSM